MTIFSRRTFTLSIVAGLAASVFAHTASAITLEEAKSQGFVRAAIHNETPYSFMTSEGTAAGIGPETTTAVLKRMGIPEVVWIVSPFSTLIPGMLAGRWDMVAAQQTILPQRCEQVAFSEPSNAGLETLLVKEGNPKNLHSYEDLKADGVKVAAVSGTTHINYLRSYEIPQDRITVIANHADGAELVRSGRVDAYLIEAPSAANLIKSGNVTGVAVPDPFKLPVIDGKEVIGFGASTFRKEDKEFLDAYNKELKAFMETPEFLEIQTKYGFTEEGIKRAKETTTASRCTPQ